MEIVYVRHDGSEESRVRTKMLPDYFFELASLVSDKEKGLYKKCRFKLDKTGEYNADFEY